MLEKGRAMKADTTLNISETLRRNYVRTWAYSMQPELTTVVNWARREQEEWLMMQLDSILMEYCKHLEMVVDTSAKLANDALSCSLPKTMIVRSDEG
jgi:hypothetical protein